ncbi:MAG: hypothetical protein RIR06_1409 [Bacteroidota bacterium]|jgi:CubicO group peptidase (beta-lactamase class C family)
MKFAFINAFNDMKKTVLLLFLLFPCCVFAQGKQGNGLGAAVNGKGNTVTPFKTELAKLEKLIQQGLDLYHVPGAAVAVVYNNEVILSKGFGVRDAKTLEPVTSKSLFAIASNSKAFTSAALAICVDRGLLKWDDLVSDYMPELKLYDAYASAHLTVRDLLSHRQGYETFGGDLIWYGTTYSREEVLRRWRFLEPKYGFRSAYGYSNIAFLAAGQLVQKVSGISWDEFVQKEFFLPLGMNSSNTSIRNFKSGDDLASPHNFVDGKNVPIPYVNWDNIGPAGSINSCVDDLAKWMMLQLNKGAWNEKVYWNSKRSFEMWEYNIFKPVSAWQRENMPTRHVNGYGLGWELMEYGGKKIVHHGGGYDGMISKTVLVPELNLGFVMLTNSNNSLPSAMTFQFLDLFLGVKDAKNWINEFAPKQDDAIEADEIYALTPCTEDVSGIYESEMYGRVEVKVVEGSLVIDFLPTALFKGTLFPNGTILSYDLIWTTQMMLPSGKVNFILDREGEVVEMRVFVDNPDFDFSELKLFKVKNK